MDLILHHNKTLFLQKVLCETRKQEETSETIVPDSYPDIGTIIGASAQAVLRGKDCRNGSVTISGGVKGCILYRSEDDPNVFSLDFYIPYSYKIEAPGLTEQTHIVSCVQVCAVDGRLINSRKAMLRTELAYRILGYEQNELSVPDFNEAPDHLQLRKQTYSLHLPLEVTEKTIKVGDVLELPSTVPAVRVHKFTCEVFISDQKLSGNKGVFKGAVTCKLLYLGTDQELHIFRQQLPFSQYCEFTEDYEKETITFFPMITGYDLETDRSENMTRIPVSVHLLMQAVVKGERQFHFPEDAYSTQGTFSPVWNNVAIDVILDHMQHTMSFKSTIPGEINDVLDIDLYWDYPKANRFEGQSVIEVPVSVHILGKNANNLLCGSSGRTQAEQSITIASDAECISSAEQQGSAFVTPSKSGLDFRMDAITDTVCSAKQPFVFLSNGTLEYNPEENCTPKIILKRIGSPCSVWDLAKEYSAKEALIKKYNQISSDHVEGNSVVLIPVG